MTSHPTIPSLGTILGVWAHPDDEAFLSAGLMSLARRHGQRVVVVTATAGEQGAPGGDRRRELADSLAACGVTEHRYLGLPDGGLAELPEAAGTALVLEALEEVRPDTVVTFGPDGMTGHPDHRAISTWTTEAWQQHGCRSRLWYATLTEDYHRRWAALSSRHDLWIDEGAPPATPPEDLVTEIRTDGPLLRRAKLAALRGHRSQTGGLIDAVGEATFADWWSSEAFVDARRVHGREVPAAA